MNESNPVTGLTQEEYEAAQMESQIETQLRLHAASLAVQLVAERGKDFTIAFNEVFKALTGRE